MVFLKAVLPWNRNQSMDFLMLNLLRVFSLGIIDPLMPALPTKRTIYSILFDLEQPIHDANFSGRPFFDLDIGEHRKRNS